jgi:hypothetical protein
MIQIVRESVHSHLTMGIVKYLFLCCVEGRTSKVDRMRSRGCL